jgi:Ca-activated chloride channel family protein
LKAEEARRLYEEIVRKNKDPALLEWMGTGLFKTSVFPVPPGQKRTVVLRYSQLCRVQEGMTDFLFPLGTAKYTSEPVERVAFRVAIESQAEIKNLYSPTHPVDIKRADERHAVVSFTLKNEVPDTDFRLFYDVGKGKLGARLLSYRPDRDGDRDGYFLLLATPEIKAAEQKPVKKTVVFVVDRSGSMSGKKIEQAKAALKFVLQNLREGDLFNVIAYDSEVEAFRPELQKFDDPSRKAALGFGAGLYAGGSTNIDAALKAALGQLQDASRPNYVLFLTDGLPTTGVTNEMKIVENARQANKVRARVFTFGVGFDLNARLLERLARDSHGQGEYVRPNEDIEDRVSRLYRRIEAPVLTDVKIEVTLDEHRPESGPAINRVYPKGSFDLFAGEQLVIAGRYKTPGNAKVVVTGSVGGQTQRFDFPAKLVDRSPDESNAFVEKLWAVRRVGEILDEIDLKGKNDELIKELVELSTRHGIITPYTSFLADETTNVRDLATNAQRAERRLLALDQTEGASGVNQRAYRGNLRRAASSFEANKAAADGFAMPAVAAPAAAGAMAGRPLAGGSQATGPSGYGGGMGGMLGPGAAEADREMAQAQHNVRQIGNRAFYRRGSQWIDSTVTKEQEANATRVKQFSREYFDLAKRHGRSLSQYLAFDEPVMVNLEGRAYLIEP